ncbi:MAG: autotransporter-associated beta strand repeat-containing protein [Candidatus Udaeobacter sp.]
MRKSKRRQRQTLPFGLFLAAMGALLLAAAVAPRANAGSTDYWDSEDPLGLRPRLAPELFSQPQGVLINQPLAFNDNPTLALNVASADQPSVFQPLVPDANASWIGGVNSTWSTAGNWTAGGPPTGAQTATFDANFTGANQPNITAATAVGTIEMTAAVTQNVTISATGTNILTINGTGIAGTGILIDSGAAFSLTITARVAVGATQAWTNNSGNLFTVSGPTIAIGNNDVLTVNGTGDTLISSNISGGNPGSSLTKDGTGTLTLSGTNTYDGNTVVNGGTLLMNGSGAGMGAVTVNTGGTLGGIGTFSNPVTVNAGGSIAPGNGGNNTGILTTGALTLASTSNFRVDINGTTVGTGYDQINVAAGGVTITGSNLVVTVGTTLSVGQTFTILNKASGGAITGTFAGIPQGGTVTGSNGTVFSVSYTSGTGGNDIVLTVVSTAPVPEPSTWMGGALAIAGLAFTQRRRLKRLMARRCAVGSS